MPTPRAWPNPFAPTTPAAIAWPAWLAFAAIVMAVGLVEIVARSVRGAWLAARGRIGAALTDLLESIIPDVEP